MENTRDKYKALLASLGVHLIIFFIAAAVGVFSMATMKEKSDNVEVVIYDEAQDEGSEGGGSPPQVEATPAVDEVVIPDKTLPPIEQKPPEESDKPSQKREARAGNPLGQGGEGKGVGTGIGDGKGPGTGGKGTGVSQSEPPPEPPPPPPPPPPKERIEASLRSEARPDYPPDLIEEDVEGSVTIKIFVASDGSIEDVAVISSSGYAEMDSAAVAAGYRFTFNPGDGGARGVWTKTFHFRLN